MRLLLLLGLCTCLACAQGEPTPTPSQPANPNETDYKASLHKPVLTVPAGTKVELALASPVWTKSVKERDSVYAVTAFPVAPDNHMAIPPGTYVQGTIDALTKPTRRSNEAEFLMHFTKLVFANGYTIQLPDANPSLTAHVYVQVSYVSDILLDNGSPVEMTLQNPLDLDAENVSKAVRVSKAPPIGPHPSATQCRPVPGTPGSPDTVIPGTPGTPGTPDTVIPGAPGMPPTVIPGTPGTPGTPPTIIPGSPGSPGIACPGPPVVTSGLMNSADTHTRDFTIEKSLQVGANMLRPGTYQIAWMGIGPTMQASINQKGKTLFSVPVRIVVTQNKADDDTVGINKNPDRTLSLQYIAFRGQEFEVHFD